MKEIFERRSVRQYEDRPVPPELTERLLRAAMAAPTARDAREWAFVAVTDPVLREKLGRVHLYAGPAGRAPLVIVPVGDLREKPVDDYWQQDLAACTQNLLLEAQHLGLGAVWMGIAPGEDRMAAVADILGLPVRVLPFALIAVGWPAEQREPRDNWTPDAVHHDRW